MSWASRRQTMYATSIILFFVVIIGGPLAYWYLSIPPTCSDGIQNQGEESIDRGGPCVLLDASTLTPPGLLWTRSFRVRDGLYSAVAYIQNPNTDAGVRSTPYSFKFYDERNVLVAERTGFTYIMPGTVTAVFQGGIETGSRRIAHTYFEFSRPLQWERLADGSNVLRIDSVSIENTESEPRLRALIRNASVRDVRDIQFVAIVSDLAGNAFAASQTAVPVLTADEVEEIVFTWPVPFNVTVGRMVVVPLVPPVAAE